MRKHKEIDSKKTETIATTVKKDCQGFALSFGKKIQEQRECLGLSMADLYNISGVSSSTINDVEKGRYLPHIDVMLKLGYALDLSLNEVLSYSTSNNDRLSHIESSIKSIKALLRGVGFNENKTSEIISYIGYQAQMCGITELKGCSKYK